MTYSIQTILTITGGRLLNPQAHPRPVEYLLTDSRRVLYPERSLFLALRGARHDGHDFLPAVYAEGVRNFIVSRAVEAERYPGANLLLVDDVVAALQRLARHHRRQFDLPVIGITGSNGKTIVKEWLFQLLQPDYYIVRSPGSYNSQVGVPLSVWQIGATHELAIFEAGISGMGEMERLAPVIDCTIGLLTNLGEAHREGFPSDLVKLQEKLRLFEPAEVILHCRDDARVDEAIRRLGKPAFSWSTRQEADLRIRQIESGEGQTRIEGQFEGRPLEVTIPFTDHASIENALHCWLVLLYLGIPQEAIVRRMASLAPVEMRLELKEGINGCIVINDSYNMDLNALINALNFLNQQRRKGRRTLLLSDILQTGMDEEQLYRQVGRLIEEKKVDRVFGIGERVRALDRWLHATVERAFFPDTAAFLNQMDTIDFHNEVVLLKGARPFTFEKIARRLAQQVHMTTLEIDLDALVHNFHLYHRQLQEGTKVMAMVKASAYGSGSLEVAKLLEYHRADYLAVAYADEGVELRQGGVRLPILILNAEPAAFEEIVRFGLEPEIYSLGQFDRFAAFTADREDPTAVHLKVDTGMHRLGFGENDPEQLLRRLAGARHLQVRSIFTHLAASEAPEHDAYTRRQVERYHTFYEAIAEVLGYRPLRHVLNSSGIARFPEYQLDMVRLGIGMYGSDASGVFTDSLQPVFHFKAHIAQVKELEPEASVGYGRRGRAAHRRRIATITAGYADGLARAAGDGRFSVMIKGQRAPITGSVCMDVCMVDVTHIPEAAEGDEVLIFGKSPTVEELAAAIHTIPYEVLTSISRRVKRVYVQG